MWLVVRMWRTSCKPRRSSLSNKSKKRVAQSAPPFLIPLQLPVRSLFPIYSVLFASLVACRGLSAEARGSAGLVADGAVPGRAQQGQQVVVHADVASDFPGQD